MIQETANDGGIAGAQPGRQVGPSNDPPLPTPGDPGQKPDEVPHDPGEVAPPPPREVPPAPAPDEGDRERA
jgi:hypothetical protein